MRKSIAVYVGIMAALFTEAGTAHAFSAWQTDPPGCAHGIAMPAGTQYNQPWVLGCAADGSGNWYVYEHTGSISSDSWTQWQGAAVRIAVDSNNTPWVVTANGNIYEGNGNNGFSELPGGGCATSIGVGNQVWVTGCVTESSGGYGIYTFNGSGWAEVGGQAVAVASYGSTTWIANAQGKVYHRNGSVWTQDSTAPCAVAIATNGSYAMVKQCNTGNLYINYNGWTQYSSGSSLGDIAIDNGFDLWLVGGNNDICTYTNGFPGSGWCDGNE